VKPAALQSELTFDNPFQDSSRQDSGGGTSTTGKEGGTFLVEVGPKEKKPGPKENFFRRLVRQSDEYKEASRAFRRTVFNDKDWYFFSSSSLLSSLELSDPQVYEP